MEDFKQYLSEDSDASERAAAERVREGLAGLRLENKIAQVAAERQNWLRRRFWARVIWIAALAFIAMAVYLIWIKKEVAAPQQPSQLEQQVQPQQPIAKDDQPGASPQTPPNEAQKKTENGPIAQIRPSEQLPAPRFQSPNIRGENNEDKAWKALLDQVWYTDYPPAGTKIGGNFAKTDELLKARDFPAAYVQLQRLERKFPENDTLRYLKGYCLLEMGEGGEALSYFEKLTGRPSSWESQLQWYRGLSLLLTGDKARALKLFKTISAQARHPYRAHSMKALRVLE